MQLKGKENTRSARFRVPEIFRIFWFGRQILYITQFSTVSYVLGLVRILYYVALRVKKDERCAFPRSRDISHFLVWQVDTLHCSILHRFLCSRACLNSLLCSLKRKKRREVRVSAFQSYSAFSGLVGRYSTLLNSPPFLMIQGLFKSIIMQFEGPKETRRARSFVPKIFRIF